MVAARVYICDVLVLEIILLSYFFVDIQKCVASRNQLDAQLVENKNVQDVSSVIHN